MSQLVKHLQDRAALKTSVYLYTKPKSVVIKFIKRYGTYSVYESMH